VAEERGAFAGTSLQRTYAPGYNWVLHGKWLVMITGIRGRKEGHLRSHIAAKNLCTGLQLDPSWQMAGHDRVLAGTRLKVA